MTEPKPDWVLAWESNYPNVEKRRSAEERRGDVTWFFSAEQVADAFEAGFTAARAAESRSLIDDATLGRMAAHALEAAENDLYYEVAPSAFLTLVDEVSELRAHYCYPCKGTGYYQGPRLGDEKCHACDGFGIPRKELTWTRAADGLPDSERLHDEDLSAICNAVEAANAVGGTRVGVLTYQVLRMVDEIREARAAESRSPSADEVAGLLEDVKRARRAHNAGAWRNVEDSFDRIEAYLKGQL